MRFSRQGKGSRLDYTISFDGKAPGIAVLVKATLTRSISAGLSQFAEQGIGATH